MKETHKEIRFYGVKPNKPLVRLIERQIEKWTHRLSPSLRPHDEPAYRVCIEREGGSCLCCHVQVQVGPERWEDVKIEVRDSQLHVSGERRLETQGDREGPMYSERRFGKFSRSFALPVGVDTGQVEASYQDGILQILVPKAESAKPRLIQISNGVGASSFLGRFHNKGKGKEDTQSSIEHRSQSVAS